MKIKITEIKTYKKFYNMFKKAGFKDCRKATFSVLKIFRNAEKKAGITRP